MNLKISPPFFKKVLILFAILSLFVILRGHIIYYLYYFNFNQEPLFFSEYFPRHVFLSWLAFGLGFVNIFFLYNIGLRIYNFKFAVFLALLYAISPWSAYVDILGSSNAYFLSWSLAFILSVILFIHNHKNSSVYLFFSAIGLLTSSIFGLFVFISLLISVYIIKYVNYSQLITVCKITLFPVLVVLYMLFSNINVTKNLIIDNTIFFQDPGILNIVNQLRGETDSANFSKLGKIIENKYLYTGEKILLNFSMDFSPSLFFSSQFKLFNFSFSPPILLGFILPFVIGIFMLKRHMKYLVVSIGLILALSLPSVLDSRSPNLEKLILVSPIIYMYIALGLITITKNIKIFRPTRLLLIVIIMVSIQALFVIADIDLREKARFDTIYGKYL
ncbi:MAG: hypothetical protein WCV81_01675 [Microgenomates group bacterium]